MENVLVEEQRRVENTLSIWFESAPSFMDDFVTCNPAIKKHSLQLPFLYLCFKSVDCRC